MSYSLESTESLLLKQNIKVKVGIEILFSILLWACKYLCLSGLQESSLWSAGQCMTTGSLWI